MELPIDRYIIRSKKDIHNIMSWVTRFKSFMNFENDVYYVLVYELKANVDARSISQNSLYWSWMGQLSKHFTGKPYTVDEEIAFTQLSKDDADELMRHNFLGYEYRKINRTELKPKLREPKKLSKRDMWEYMTKIDNWAADHDCLLVRPHNSEYDKYREASQ